MRIGARLGVVFASGGFVHDAELRRNYLSDPVFSGCGFHANEGDFVHIAGAVGAAFGNMNYAWMCPLPFEWAVARKPDLSGVFTVPGDSMIFVNKYGRRAANEKAPYNELARSFFAWDAYRGEYPNYLQFMLYDDRCARLWAGTDYGNVIPPPGADDAHVVRAETLQELEAAIGERLARYGALAGGVRLEPGWAAEVAGSITRFNEHAARGEDPDFHRGASPIEPIFNGPARGENVGDPTMYPLSADRALALRHPRRRGARHEGRAEGRPRRARARRGRPPDPRPLRGRELRGVAERSRVLGRRRHARADLRVRVPDGRRDRRGRRERRVIRRAIGLLGRRRRRSPRVARPRCDLTTDGARTSHPGAVRPLPQSISHARRLA